MHFILTTCEGLIVDELLIYVQLAYHTVYLDFNGAAAFFKAANFYVLYNIRAYQNVCALSNNRLLRYDKININIATVLTYTCYTKSLTEFP